MGKILPNGKRCHFKDGLHGIACYKFIAHIYGARAMVKFDLNPVNVEYTGQV